MGGRGMNWIRLALENVVINLQVKKMRGIW